MALQHSSDLLILLRRIPDSKDFSDYCQGAEGVNFVQAEALITMHRFGFNRNVAWNSSCVVLMVALQKLDSFRSTELLAEYKSILGGNQSIKHWRWRIPQATVC